MKDLKHVRMFENFDEPVQDLVQEPITAEVSNDDTFQEEDDFQEEEESEEE
jgi:hypothetical protein